MNNKSISIDLSYFKEENCEYEKKCPITSSKFCSSDSRFECKKYRELEEKQMTYEDDL